MHYIKCQCGGTMAGEPTEDEMVDLSCVTCELSFPMTKSEIADFSRPGY